MKQIPLTQGQFALVDDEDFEALNQFKWFAHKCCHGFYAARKTRKDGKKTMCLMHRYILGLTDKRVQGDHCNGNGLDNQKHNLRGCTHSENLFNRGAQKNNKSGFKGVCWEPRNKRWRAQIAFNGKRIHIGLFLDLTEAARAYQEAATIYHKDFKRI